MAIKAVCATVLSRLGCLDWCTIIRQNCLSGAVAVRKLCQYKEALVYMFIFYKLLMLHVNFHTSLNSMASFGMFVQMFCSVILLIVSKKVACVPFVFLYIFCIGKGSNNLYLPYNLIINSMVHFEYYKDIFFVFTCSKKHPL